ncbi:MAG: metallophosphoesterase family protein [Nitrososphaerota archaeon]|nr:metallophosphoesterase family protein [Nitrososphaerota archaeon]
MKALLISDVHANLPALDAVLNKISYDRVLFMGDAVDYGPFPFEVYSRLHQVRAIRVLGNHDAAASFGVDCQSTPEMHEASILTRNVITSKRMPKRAMQALGKKAHRKMFLEYNDLRILMVHGSPTEELYQYVSREDAANLVEPNVDLIVLGHTHIPYEVKNENTWVVNPGSVGMPRDGNPRASCAILDTYNKVVHFERVDYDIEPMLSKLQQLLAPNTKIYEFLADIFRTGRERRLVLGEIKEAVPPASETAYLKGYYGLSAPDDF